MTLPRRKNQISRELNLLQPRMKNPNHEFEFTFIFKTFEKKVALLQIASYIFVDLCLVLGSRCFKCLDKWTTTE